MSSYLTFYIRGNDDRMVELGSYCRSSEIYQAFEAWAPYEDINALSETMLSNVIADQREYLEKAQERLKRNKNEIEFLKSCVMDTDERMERYNDCIEDGEYIEEAMEEYKRVIQFAHFLNDILDAYDYNQVENSTIYFGVEVCAAGKTADEVHAEKTSNKW